MSTRSVKFFRRRGTRGGRMFLVIFGSWIVVYFAARALLGHYGSSLPTPMRLVVAVMPVAVLSGVFSMALRVLSQADELERLIHLLATAIALPLVAVTALAIGMLRHAGIIHDLWPFITAFYFLGYVIARLHYHVDEDASERDGLNLAGDNEAKAP